MAEQITNRDDVIDSRAVISRMEELQTLIDSLTEELAIPNPLVGPPNLSHKQRAEAEDRIGEAKAELETLQALASQADGYATDWEHGSTLVRDSYFEDYAQELAEDIGAINRNATWPNNCIDWEQAARELRMDYTSVDFDGITYWVR